ncbi:hypothetical protein A3D77_07140 [Candidatus Gottesmanbacteria bacterium RIFCSPHIGHO2_02_FULL_39_11]|uniref:Polysaccharide biosynthesis protein C-terminal domain-containing protein n=1 Tax=Candidatus Gottesmanbacteria bacterium RIFCSPHIGHO2_02_FULL_39_11 TaxID=1798382 RepID=A0A1F5ZKB3_9BACT|nr:MAG: hypothetical protein A3D77_07140 [Candidatus Gottesmanbacteria bacterium RIFCSPHIGHO2_02_FULL_39_11]
MEKVDVSEIKRKILSGVFALTSRTLILQVVSVISQTLLTVILTPAVFGTYYIATAFTDFFNYFADIGLAAALIQKKDEPTLKDLRTVFTVQQMLITVLVVLGLIFSDTVGNFYHLDAGGIFLVRALLISFFLSSLKTIPSILLERRLNFNLLVVPQLFESIVFNILVILFALNGMGVYSFAWAAIARGIVGVVTIYIISPWSIGFDLSIKELKKLLSYGVPIQANSFLALIKDNLMTLFLGRVLNLTQVGYIGWAKKTSELVLRLFMDNVIRVTFPAYSRLQEHLEILAKAVERSFFFLAFFIFPTSAALILFMHPLMEIVPRYSKWEPALLSFYLFSFASLWAAFSTAAINALNAIGKIKWTLILMVLWTAITWIGIPILIHLVGFNGAAITAAIIAATGILPIILLKRKINYDALGPLLKPLTATFLMIVLISFFLSQIHSVISFGTLLVVFILGYALISFIWMKSDIKPYVLPILNKIIKNK